jgi:hypothetical protein
VEYSFPMGTSIGKKHIILFCISIHMKSYIHNGHPWRHGNIMKFDYGLGYATRKLFGLQPWYTCSIPLLSYWGRDCHIQAPMYLEAILSQPHDIHD